MVAGLSVYLEMALAALGDGLVLTLEVTLVVTPLLILYELAKAYGVFDRPWPGLTPLMARMGLGSGALVPLLAGIFLGLLYGAGILLAMSRENDLTDRERLALAVFLALCHAVVEDTALFVLLGGSAWAILLPRFILALGLTAWMARRRPAG